MVRNDKRGRLEEFRNTLIIFKVRTVYILFLGTHQEYGEVDAATITFKK
jgi:mRNA-degrading endonuclease HigB of HigAB toxin-antitoxin module